LLEEFPNDLQTWIRNVADPFIASLKAAGKRFELEHFLKPTWQAVRQEDYERFYSLSEYAAWTAAFGIQVNHFTVLVNELKTVSSLEELNQLLMNEKFILNSAGGAIKGTPAELLEQSSTQANRVEWKFSNGVSRPIMSCYYEFARRYPDPSTGRLFQGFIPKSADKIFESTFEKS
jgi:hypothetical protein